MNNRHPTELLSAYLDGEATTAEREVVARHLEACDGCRVLLDDFRRMAAIAAQEQPPSIPTGMTARIIAALGAPAPQPRRVFSLWSPLPLAVAASLLVVVTGTWVLVRRQEERQPVVVSRAAPVESDVPSPPSPPEPAQEIRQPGPIARDDQGGRHQRLKPSMSESEPGRTEPSGRSEPPVVAKPHPEKDAADALRSLGYVGTVERGAPPVAPVSPAPPPAAAAREAQPGLVEAKAAGLVAGGRSIVFEVNGGKGTLTEAGLVTLILDQGACSVDLSASPAAGEEVRSIFRLASAPPAPRSAPRSNQAPVAAPSGEPPAAGDQETQPPANRVRLLFPASRPVVAAANVEQVEDRLQHLLDVTARDLLESGCGRR